MKSFKRQINEASIEVASWSKEKRKAMQVTLSNPDEYKYLGLLKEILDKGEDRNDRTGIGTKAIFGSQLKFSLENNTLPLLTTKKMFTKGIIEELLFFLRGETNTKLLELKGVNIWKGNTSREFLDKRGLNHYPEGEMGPMYGSQWRNFNGDGIDQIANAIDLIKNDPYSRRIIVTALNPSKVDQSVLYPCHTFFQLYVSNKKELSCLVNVRSQDIFLGSPFNIASYALLTHIIAKLTRLNAKELIMNMGDTHIYLNHIDQVNVQLERSPNNFPTVEINKELNSVSDIEQLQYSDFKILNYKCHPAIKAPMAI